MIHNFGFSLCFPSLSLPSPLSENSISLTIKSIKLIQNVSIAKQNGPNTNHIHKNVQVAREIAVHSWFSQCCCIGNTHQLSAIAIDIHYYCAILTIQHTIKQRYPIVFCFEVGTLLKFIDSAFATVNIVMYLNEVVLNSRS